MIETYKILNSYYRINPSLFFTLNTSSSTRGHSLKLFKNRSRLLVRHNFFSNRVVNMWNSLPDHLVSAPSVAAFKRRLDDYWNATGYGYLQRPAAQPGNFIAQAPSPLNNNNNNNNNKVNLAYLQAFKLTNLLSSFPTPFHIYRSVILANVFFNSM